MVTLGNLVTSRPHSRETWASRPGEEGPEDQSDRRPGQAGVRFLRCGPQRSDRVPVRHTHPKQHKPHETPGGQAPLQQPATAHPDPRRGQGRQYRYAVCTLRPCTLPRGLRGRRTIGAANRTSPRRWPSSAFIRRSRPRWSTSFRTVGPTIWRATYRSKSLRPRPGTT